MTYPNVRRTFCRRHGTWLGGRSHQQRVGVLTAERWKAERGLRRMVARGEADHVLIDMAWELVRDQHFLIDPVTWDARMTEDRQHPHFAVEVDDRLVFLTHTVRVLTVLTRPDFPRQVRSGIYDRHIRRAHLLDVCEYLAFRKEAVEYLAPGA